MRIRGWLGAALLLLLCALTTMAAEAAQPGCATYFVNPSTGDDANNGKSAAKAWKSFARLNGLRLAPGDKVMVAPGLHEVSLNPTAAGTADQPVVIEFLAGVHEFAQGNALRRPWHISNSCDSPAAKPVAVLVEHSKHLRLEGGGTDGVGKTLLLMRGRMMYFVNDHAEDITYTGLVFDLKRPTVSEFRVMEVGTNHAVIQVAEGSTYEIKDGRFAWTGELGTGGVMAQQADPETGKCWRMGIGWNPFANATAEDSGGGKVRLTYASGHPALTQGRQFHFRATFRDSAAGFNNRCKDIAFRDCDFYALVNMGVISQFTENITWQRVRFVPPKDTLRTCPCWADAIHFSGCKGDILVDSCVFSGLQDDPVNVHGTHLRIIAKAAENQLHLRFMHPQTWGFAAFAPGDEVAVINHANLRELPGNPRRKVTAIAPLPGDQTGKEWLLTLDCPAPAFGKDDVVDNLTWYPNFTARSNYVTMDSCRGFLITTRGKVLVEGNTFNRCAMAGILTEDDAEGWFESGPIRDMTIRGNRFIGCHIEINPHTRPGSGDQPVHENIRILDNFFDGGSITARNVKGLTIIGNRFSSSQPPVITTPHSTDLKIENNQASPKAFEPHRN